MALSVYLAGPLFSEAERDYNRALVDSLESIGCSVFSPQQDAVDVSKPDFERLSLEQQTGAIFESNKNQIFGCDVFLFCLDGRIPDEGACVELGLVSAHRELSVREKLIIGLHTDVRVATETRRLNAMLLGALDEVFTTRAALLEYLQEQATRFRR